jgi:hypothetical protein
MKKTRSELETDLLRLGLIGMAYSDEWQRISKDLSELKEE